MNINENNIKDSVWDAVENKNELLLKKSIVIAMTLYLKNKISREELDDIGSIYLMVPIKLRWNEEFKINDKKLRYVLEELSAIEVEKEDKAKEKVKRFISYLNE